MLNVFWFIQFNVIRWIKNVLLCLSTFGSVFFISSIKNIGRFCRGWDCYCYFVFICNKLCLVFQNIFTLIAITTKLYWMNFNWFGYAWLSLVLLLSRCVQIQRWIILVAFDVGAGYNFPIIQTNTLDFQTWKINFF